MFAAHAGGRFALGGPTERALDVAAIQSVLGGPRPPLGAQATDRYVVVLGAPGGQRGNLPARSGSPMPNSTLTLLGARKVRSKPATAPDARGRRSWAPDPGSRPSSSSAIPPSVTSPRSASDAAPLPTHAPGASPSPA